MLLSAGWATASGLLDEFLFESVQNGFPKVTVSATGGKGIEKAGEFQKNVCFIDFTKAFDCVQHFHSIIFQDLK